MKVKLYKIKIVVILITVISISFFAVTCAKNQHYKLSQFISPDTCGGCHSEIHEQWQNSMHNLAHKDPLYTKVALFLRKGLTDKSEIKEAESCVKCHTPVGFVTGFPKKLSDDLDKSPDIAKEGIQCDYCHSAVSAKKMYNNGIVLSPGNGSSDPGVKRGPFKDSKASYHKTAFSKFHTESQICGTCHDVRHVVFDTKLETTYEEWFNGPYNSKDPDKKVTCQGCHMYQRPGMPSTGSTARMKNPGKAAYGAPEREHIFTHYFVGANSLIPGNFGDKKKPAMAIERLQNAAEIEIDGSKIKGGLLSISVKNTGAGHYLPTGLADVRQMWLEIRIKDNKGKMIYVSGGLDKDKYILKDTIVYNTVFGDGSGNPVNNISKAKEILKNYRIPPGKALKEEIKLPSGKRKFITVDVKLRYRIAPQKITDVVLGKGKLNLPVVEMEKVSKKIIL